MSASFDVSVANTRGKVYADIKTYVMADAAEGTHNTGNIEVAL